jgi:hypothetical protein
MSTTNQPPLTKKQKKALKKEELEKAIAGKLSSIGRAQLVATQRAPPARQATNLLKHGEYDHFVSVKEAWCLHLLHHLMSPSSHIVPPTPEINLTSATALPFRFLGYTGASSFTPNTFNFGNDLNSRDGKFIAPVRPLLDGHEMNYIPVEGRCFTTTSIVGNEKKYIWVDPFDYDEPLKINGGPDTVPAAVQGAFSALPPYDSTLGAERYSQGFPWSVGYDPRVVPTEWVNIEGIETGGDWGHALQEQLYPAIPDPYETPYEPCKFYATNLIEWVCDVEIIVSVANPTAFSATAMRVRTQDTSQNRWSQRIEDPPTGDYGFTGPFVTSNLAEARWRGSSWAVPLVHRAVTNDVTPQILSYATTQYNSSLYANRGSANWESLQRCLSEMMPVIEVQQNADSPTRSVDLSIEVKVMKCIVPVYTPTATISREHLTFPAHLPKWYSALAYEGSVSPTDTSVRLSQVPYAVPMQAQLGTAAVRALHKDTSDHRAIQRLAQATPPVSGVVTKQHKGILDKITKVGQIANDVVHQAADTANTGWGIAKGLKKLGSELWSGLSHVGSWLGKGAAAALPIAEDVALLAL